MWGSDSMRGNWKNSLGASLLFVLCVDILMLTFYDQKTISEVLSIALTPGALAVYSWAPIHDLTPFILMQLANVLVYFLILRLIGFVRMRLMRDRV
jgi:hypothetical protein